MGFLRVESVCGFCKDGTQYVGFVRVEHSMWVLQGWNNVCGFCKGETPCVGFVRVKHRVWVL